MNIINFDGILDKVSYAQGFTKANSTTLLKSGEFFIEKDDFALINVDDSLDFSLLKNKISKIKSESLKEKTIYIFYTGTKLQKSEKYLLMIAKSFEKANLSYYFVGIPPCYCQFAIEHSYDLLVYTLYDNASFKEHNYFEDCRYCRLRMHCPGSKEAYKSNVYPVFKDFIPYGYQLRKENNIFSEVFVSKQKEYDFDSILKSVKEAFDKLGIYKRISNTSKIWVKPNLADPFPPEKSVTTNPIVVKAVICALKEKCQNIWLGDISAGTNYEDPDKVYNITGIKKISDEEDVKLVYPKEHKYITRDIDSHYWVDKTDYLDIEPDLDLIVNVPKYKTHGISFFTGAIKNMFGTIHPEERKYIHSAEDKNKFCKGLCDVYKGVAHKVLVNVMDGIASMEGDEGPTYGTTVNTGFLLISRDPIAIDSIACEIVGYASNAMPTGIFGNNKMLGEIDLERIKTNIDIKEIKVPVFQKNSLFDYINTKKENKDFGKLYLFEVKINEKCVRCLNCLRSCPVGAISQKEDGSLEIDQKKCIHCYTCQEVCPNGGIDLVKIDIKKNTTC